MNEPLLIPANEVSALLGISRTKWMSMADSGKTPEAVRIGRRVLYRREEILAWVDAGCPTREMWEGMPNNRWAAAVTQATATNAQKRPRTLIGTPSIALGPMRR